MNLLHESVVKESEIDSLGHMNVRFYVARAAEANNRLLGDIGVSQQLGQGQIVRRVDTYNRFLREQFAGAPLEVHGGLVTGERITDTQGVTAYYEIRNPESGDVAAAFIMTSAFVNSATQEIAETPQPTTELQEAFRIHVPEYGVPRSLKLTEPKVVTLDELMPHMPSDPTPGMMSGMREAKILSEDCDENGRFREDTDLMFALFRPQPGDDLKSMGPPVVRDEHGRRYSFAMMETRSLTWDRPMADTTLVALGADLAFGEKWRHSRRWMFEKESSKLLGVSDSIGLCMDLDARKAIPIPAEVRASVEAHYLPQFA